MLINSTKRWLTAITFFTSQIIFLGLAPSFVRQANAQEIISADVCSELAQATSSNATLNYSDLEHWLQQQNWQAADEETYSLILQAAGREDRRWLGHDDMTTFPCSVLQRIDELWLQHSKGHFGYSVQTEIEQDCFNEQSDFYPAAMQCLANAIGWNDWQDTQFNFSLSAPAGHLPTTNRRLAKALYEACGDPEAAENALSSEDRQQCSHGMITFAYVSPLALISTSECDYFAHLRTESELDQEEAIALYNRGNNLRDQGEIEAAEAAFRQAIELDSDFAEAYNNLGVVVGMQGRLDEAHEIFVQTLELDPEHASAYSNLGKVFFLQNNFDDAIVAYRQSIDLSPTDAISYDGLGLALREQGNLSLAISAFRRAIELQPSLQSAQNHLNETQLLLGD